MDLIRYTPGVVGGQLALFCTDCGDPTNPLPPRPIWTEADAAEQVTEFCLANLVAIAEEHDREHHAEPARFDLSALLGPPAPPPPAPHRVKVYTVHCINMTDDSDHYDEARYDVEHTPQCDALPYGQDCWLDWQQTEAGTDDWPTEPGEYIVTGEAVKSFNGETTEYDFYVDFEPAPAADETAVKA